MADVDPGAPVRLLVVLRKGVSAANELTDYAVAHGLSAAPLDPSGTAFALSGTYAQACDAFAPEGIGVYQAKGRRFVGRAGRLHVPPGLAPAIVAVMGFDQRNRLRNPVHVVPDAELGDPANRAYGPGQLAGLYGFPPGLTGTGQTIGIVACGGGYDSASMDAYFGGRRTGRLDWVSADGTPNDPTTTGMPDHDNAIMEVQMDIEIIGTIAPAADIVVYFGAQGGLAGMQSALQRAVNDPRNPSVISISWGIPEDAAATEGEIAAMEQILAAARDRNITVCVASGDAGAHDDPAAADPVVSYPAGSPNVLACGGTSFPAGGVETAWAGSGGGYSNVQNAPDYQGGIGAGNRRAVPDVAAMAAPGVAVSINGTALSLTGTSVAAPIWAGLVALANQQAGRRAGFINPSLYRNPGVCNDIIDGGNNDYQAGRGWDAVTGLGSPKGQDICRLLAQPANLV